jgi:hypothetical protein
MSAIHREFSEGSAYGIAALRGLVPGWSILANIRHPSLAVSLGRMTEALSKTRFWAKTVVCVLEDDPQNGSDHRA